MPPGFFSGVQISGVRFKRPGSIIRIIFEEIAMTVIISLQLLVTFRMDFLMRLCKPVWPHVCTCIDGMNIITIFS